MASDFFADFQWDMLINRDFERPEIIELVDDELDARFFDKSIKG